MISLTTLLVTVAISAIIYIYLNHKKDKRGNLPPGPISLPILGSLLSFGKQPFKKFMEWGDTYPKMCTVGFGGNQVVLLNDLQIIRETFNDPRFSGRADIESFNLAARGPHGILSSSGQEWIDQRRFTVRHLRDFGFGKKTMEALIMEDVNEFLSELKSLEGQPISNVMKMFNLTVINSLWTIISGKRHGHHHDEIATILSNFTKVKESFTIVAMLLPKIAKIFPKLSGWRNINELIDMERDYVHREIKEHEKKWVDDGNNVNPEDFMDSYLNEIKGTADTSSSFYKERGIQSLIAVSLDLFNAGTETTSTTLSWTILYLAKLQGIQKKLQDELDTVIGTSRQISLADRPNLPYTEALIMEILRHSAIIVATLFHTTTEDVADFHGYYLPKGTMVSGNKFYIHHSSKYWDEPEEFKPERFLSDSDSDSTKRVKKPEAFIPFSVGKRACLGETLARDEIFLFMTNIFQRFNAKLTDDSLSVALEQKGGLTQGNLLIFLSFL